MSVVRRRPKVGDSIRFALRHGSAPGTVLARVNRETSKVRDDRATTSPTAVPIFVNDENVVYINDHLTGNESDDEC